MEKAVFFDKDGTLIKNVPYNVDPAKIEFSPFARKTLEKLKGLGFKLILVSNQSGLARGYFSLDEMERLKEWFRQKAQLLDDFYYCPHLVSGTVPEYAKECSCRKPKPGLLLKAAREHQIDLKHSWMVGDTLDDVEAGNRADCQTIFLEVGNEMDWETGKHRKPDFIVKSLREVGRIIITN